MHDALPYADKRIRRGGWDRGLCFAIQLGADALSVLSKNVNTATAPTVYFGQNHENNPAAWRVIGYDGSGVTSSKGDITLLAAGAMGVIPFVDAILNNEYAPSNLKTAIDALKAKLTTEENAAVKKRALTSGSYDGENTDCVAGGQVDNAVFWPLSAKEAIAVNNDLRALDPAHPNWVTIPVGGRAPPAPINIISPSCVVRVLSNTLGTLSSFSIIIGLFVPLLT